MATNPFATPSPAGTTTPAQPFTNGQAPHDEASALEQQSGQVAEAPYIAPDLDDPMLLAETLTAKEGDAFAEPPPPPDRIYRVQLKLRGVGKDDWKGDIAKYSGGADRAPWVPEFIIDKQTKQNVGLYAKTIVDVQIHDAKYPEYEGIFLQVPFKWMDTREGRNHGPSKIMTLLNLSKRPDGTPWLAIGRNYGPKALMEVFLQFLAGEPELRCQSMWSWTCQGCTEEGKKTGKYPNSIDGMQKFNPIAGKAGVYNHELRCEVNRAHGFSKARAMASQYFALEGK